MVFFTLARYLILYQAGSVQSCSYEGALKRAEQVPLPDATVTLNSIPLSTRAHWMRVANQAPVDLVSPCSFAPYGTAIVNHTNNAGLGELICIGANSMSSSGNPSLHGEIAAINNCTSILRDASGPYRYTPAAVLTAWEDLTLYTNGEACSMCASAIRWAGFREYVFGTSIDTLSTLGWSQITIRSYDVFEQSWPLGTTTSYLGGVLENETDPSFSWQYSMSHPCPKGCARNANGVCSPV